MAEEIANLRTLIVELRPAALDEYGVAAAIESLAERTAARQGIAVDVHVDLAWERGDAPTRHTPELESTVYRLVQESLTNAVRHAGASRVRIEVTEHDGFVEVAVADDGTRLRPRRASRRASGSRGCASGSRSPPASSTIQTAPGGTTVRARLPARRAATDTN